VLHAAIDTQPSAPPADSLALRTLVGGIGYAWQGDLAFGTDLVAALQQLAWPAEIEIADLSHNPIAVFQQIRAQRYERLILVGAVRRGRPPGLLDVYEPTNPLPPAAEIQERIIESGSGVISLDNIVIICRFYDALPADTRIVEVEPIDDLWGTELSPPARAALQAALQLIRDWLIGGESGAT